MPSASFLRSALIASARSGTSPHLLRSLSDDDALRLYFDWDAWARPDQRPPMTAWRTWMLMGGRGAGKTRAGAEWVRGAIAGRPRYAPAPCGHIALVGETFADAREVMVSGVSGLIAIAPPWDRPRYEAGRKRLVWDNGAVARLYSATDPDALRGSQFDAAWCDEFGAPATDLAGNRPSAFPSDKPSADALPPFSRGERDDAVQRAILDTALDVWGTPGSPENPLSGVDGRAMIDPSAIHLWTWDARPFPIFPLASGVWSDSGNWYRGHWLNGRLGASSLGELLTALAIRYDLPPIDVSAATGVVEGYLLPGPGKARGVFDDLAKVFGFLARPKGEGAAVVMRSSITPSAIAEADLAVQRDTPLVHVRRADSREVPQQITLGFRSPFHDHKTGIVRSAALPGLTPESPKSDGQEEVLAYPLTLDPAEAGRIAERLLHEAVVGGETLELSVPPSLIGLEPGDCLAVTLENWADPMLVRVDRLTDGAARRIEAHCVDPAVYTQAPTGPDLPVAQPRPAFGAIDWLVLDLPAGDNGSTGEHGVYLAAFAQPWPGSIDIAYAPPVAGDEEPSFSSIQQIAQPATIGTLASDLTPGPVDVTDTASELIVDVSTGALETITPHSLLQGGNRAAIVSNGTIEIIAFQSAELIAQDRYRLGGLLRGLGGTGAQAETGSESGARFVLLDSALDRLDLSTEQAMRGGLLRATPLQTRQSGVEPETRSFAVTPRSLRPLAPAHLRAQRAGADIVVSWVRCARGQSDDWTLATVPLIEDEELYELTIRISGSMVRQQQVASPTYTYTAVQQAEDGVTDGFVVNVRQLGYGQLPGQPASIEVVV